MSQLTCGNCGTTYDQAVNWTCPQCGSVRQQTQPAPTSAPEIGLFEGLVDWRLRKFITRKVNAVLYTLLFWLIVLLTPVFAYSSFQTLRGKCFTDQFNSTYCSGSYPDQAWLAIPVVLLAAFILLVTLRLTFETSIALVAIAQNTEPKK